MKAVEVLAGPVIAHRRGGSACRAAIWTSRRSTQASSMVVTNVCLSMCGCGLVICTPEASASRRRRCGVPVHAGAATIQARMGSMIPITGQHFHGLGLVTDTADVAPSAVSLMIFCFLAMSASPR
jgi:hypothetical protein